MAGSENTYWRDSIDKGKAIEAKLAALQDKHRLAIHTFEKHDSRRGYPVDTLADLEHNSAYFQEGRAAEMPPERAALLSMTLLPSLRSGKSVSPYTTHNCGYLFDLSTHHPTSAWVVRGFKESGSTGDNAYSKALQLNNKTGIPALDEVYSGLKLLGANDEEQRRAFIPKVAQNPALSGEQLDALGKHMEGRKEEVLPYNELLVAASKRHIAAIVKPMECFEAPLTEFDIHKAQLMAVLGGLEHAQNGLELPVVFYHIDAPNQNKCTYIASGTECGAVARDTIGKMQKHRRFEHYLAEQNRMQNSVPETAQRLLGIDMSTPLPKSHYR